MKLKIYFFLVLLFLLSCKSEVTREDIGLLNGFWEIEKVQFQNGEVKEYKVNEAVEQFEIHKDSGKRRKVKVLLDGNFIANHVLQTLVIEQKEGSWVLNNKTDFDQWEEKIIELNKSLLLVENQAGIIYFYKKRDDIKLD